MNIRNIVKHFDPRDIRDHWASNMCEWHFEGVTHITFYHKFVTFKGVMRERLAALICDLRGHDYDTDGHDYPESGGEGFTCKRCGHSFTAWH